MRRRLISEDKTIQPPLTHSHFERYVFIPVFDKTKNASMWRGAYFCERATYQNSNSVT